MGTATARWARAATIVVALAVLGVPLGAAAIETDTFGFEPWPVAVAGQPRGGFDLRLPPGGAVTEQARLYNKTDETRTYRLYGADVSTDPETGELSTSSAGATPTGVGSWIVLGEDVQRIELGPREHRIIDVIIERPRDVTTGGLGAVVAEELAPSTAGDAINVRFRIALRIDATAGSGDGGLVVERLDLDVPFQLLPRAGTVTAVVRNAEADTVTAHVQLHVDRGGRRYLVLQEPLTLRPGQEAEYVADWGSVPVTGGPMTPGVEIAWEGGDLRLHGEDAFVVPGWAPTVLLVLTAWALLRFGRRDGQ